MEEGEKERERKGANISTRINIIIKHLKQFSGSHEYGWFDEHRNNNATKKNEKTERERKLKSETKWAKRKKKSKVNGRTK